MISLHSRLQASIATTGMSLDCFSFLEPKPSFIMLSHLTWIGRIDPHPSLGQSCTVGSKGMRPVMPIDWLIQPEIMQYWQWHHLQVTCDDIISPPMVGNLRLWVTDDISSGYLLARSGQAWKQAVMCKFDWQNWGIKPQPIGGPKTVPTPN